MLKYKQNRKLITVICEHCGEEYQKPLSEYIRNTKLNRKSFCSRYCAGYYVCKNFKTTKPIYNISQHSNNRKDEYSSFRYYLSSAKNRNHECTITLEDLKKQWELQDGKCIYTNITLIHHTHSKYKGDKMYLASLDRIDSSIGYIVGNIQFVATPINLMKNNFSHEQTVEFCKIIAKNIIIN